MMEKKPLYLPITDDMSNEEKQRRHKINQGIASCALEGMYPRAESIAELELVASGKITSKECLARLKAKYSNHNDAENNNT